MTIETYGRGERLGRAAKMLREASFPHLVLLPVPTTKDKKFVTGTDIPLEDTLVNLSSESIVVGYSLPEEYKKSVFLRGSRVIDLSLDEEYLRENAYLTALGTLGYLLTGYSRQLCGMRIGIIGYGRIGKELLRLFLFFGARPRVYTLRSDVAFSLAARGVDASVGYGIDFNDVDILINTAPTDLSFLLDKSFSSEKRIIELASGENFGEEERVERLAAIPERMYPESAAESYARAVKRLL